MDSNFGELRQALAEEKRRGAVGPAQARAGKAVAGLLDAMRAALDAGDGQRAFSLGITAKSFHLPAEGLDLLRARAFLLLDRRVEAGQSLREELRHFPDNAPAAALLEELRDGADASAREAAEEGEFAELLDLVREHTMLGVERLRSLYELAKSVCQRDVPGSFVECGVAGGGSSALLALTIARHSRRPRTLYALDSFEGMPEPGARDVHQGAPAQDTGWGAGTCASPERAVRALFESLGVSHLVDTRKGLFQDTLPGLRETLAPVALLHLDGDWYDSTLAVLENLHGLHAPGGFLQIDDYGYWDGCRQAVHEFAARHGLHLDLRRIDATGVWCDAPQGGAA